ncbi:MAG: MFS transporter [Rikenellaceae bacterium]
MSVSTNQQNREWDGVPMPNRIFAAAAVMLAVGMGVLDGVIINIALPTICDGLFVSASHSIWIVNAYQISVIVSLLPLSALGDFVGYRKIYIGGICLFTLTSIGCALSWSFASLVSFRVLQGIGASAVMSINTSIVRLIYPKRMLGRGLGFNSTIVSVSSVAGPTLAAALLAVAEWPLLFAVNIPIGIMAIVMGYRYIPQNPSLRQMDDFRWGDALMSILTFGLLFALITGVTHGVPWRLLLLEALLLVAVGYLFVRGQLLRSVPILPFDLLKIPIFSLSILTSILSFIAQMAVMVAMPFILHRQFGYSTLEIGAIITAWPVVNLFASPVAGMLVDKFHAGVLGCIGLLVLTSGMALLAFMPSEPSTWEIMLRLAVCGLGFGFFQAPNNNIIISSAPLSRSGSASGMMATARLTGQIVGAAAVAMLFYVVPDESLTNILYVGFATTALATIVSFSRLSLPLS